jgi:hypothetical protein
MFVIALAARPADGLGQVESPGPGPRLRLVLVPMQRGVTQFAAGGATQNVCNESVPPSMTPGAHCWDAVPLRRRGRVIRGGEVTRVELGVLLLARRNVKVARNGSGS